MSLPGLAQTPGRQETNHCARLAAQSRLLQALDAVEGLSAMAFITLPAPLVGRPELLLRARGDETGVLWAPFGEEARCGIGVAHLLSARGPDRFARIQEGAQALWEKLALVPSPGLEAKLPRLLGGFAFQPGSAGATPWAGFGDAKFVLPRWTYGCEQDQAWLGLALSGEEIGREGQRPRLMTELGEILDALCSPWLPHPDPAPPVRAILQISREDWRSRLQTIRAAIQEGRAEKIVAARLARVDLHGPLDELAVLARLGAEASVTRFAFCFGGATFLGASPERLVGKIGERVRTEALAGTIARGNEQRLLGSQKDRLEQGLVVTQILECLAPFCKVLDHTEKPTICSLTHVLHLRTPIEGRLKGSCHVLALVEALHPTPAVAGVPTPTALSWIADQEGDPRGWYAGPVGWFDARGDGEFAVALRSGVLEGASAYLYAGAGIVRDSDPDKEYEETALKQRTFLTALGVRP